MALDSRALISRGELLRRARIDEQSSERFNEIEDAINEASAIVRRAVGRRLLYLGTDYVEFHNIYHGESTLWLRERPIITITEIAEDPDRTFDSGTVLTEDTDFLIDKNRGTAVRISGSSIIAWESGPRSIRVTYSGGYDDQAGDKANVPSDLKYVTSNVALRIFRENDRAMQGVSSKSDTAGSTTRFDARKLAENELEMLYPFMVRGPQTYVSDEAVA